MFWLGKRTPDQMQNQCQDSNSSVSVINKKSWQASVGLGKGGPWIMSNGKRVEVGVLDGAEPEKVIQTLEVLHGSFAGSDRYTVARLNEELKLLGEPLYRQFFIATVRTKKTDRVIGVGGVKAADWASNTHILYLSAVHPEFRNLGVGKKLVKARVEWIRSHFADGRVLVSTPKIDRFKQFGFSQVSESCDKGRAIMLMEF